MTTKDIIVVGGSSGATQPLKAMLSRLPADLPAAVFVAIHIPAQSKGMLATVVAAAGALPAVQAEDGMAIERGRVYVAAPDRHLLIVDGVLRLGRGPRENMMRPAIDPLFRSAAVAFGPRVIGIVLSGLLNDGAAGLDAIKRCGGMALVQDPADAQADEMPRRALEAVVADLCVPSAKLGEVLIDLVREPAAPQLPPPADLLLDIEIAGGMRSDSGRLRAIADPVPLSCPACGGVLSQLHVGHPQRFRCQVGHSFTAEALAAEQEHRVDEAMRVALRIVEERAELVNRMAEDGRRSGRPAVAHMYADRAREYYDYAETLREAILKSFEHDRKVEND